MSLRLFLQRAVVEMKIQVVEHEQPGVMPPPQRHGMRSAARA
jgi:hypothetical protein